VCENTPDVNDSPVIIHANYEPIIIIANIKNDEFLSDGIGASVCVSDILGTGPVRTLDDLMPRIQGYPRFRMFSPIFPKRARSSPTAELTADPSWSTTSTGPASGLALFFVRLLREGQDGATTRRAGDDRRVAGRAFAARRRSFP